MEKIIEYLKIINEYRHINISFDTDILGRPIADFELNGYTLEKLKTHLEEMFNDFKYDVVQQPESVLSQIRNDIALARKDFNYLTIEGCNYIFQTGIKETKHGTGFTSNQDELIENIEEGIEIKVDVEKYEGDVIRSNQFSQIKYDALNKLENLLDLNFSDSVNNYKLKTKLSVGDLSLLFRLLYEEKLLDVENNTDLYRFIAQNFSTKQSANLSDKSIKNKFLSPDNTALKNIDILLVNLRQQLKKIQ